MAEALSSFHFLRPGWLAACPLALLLWLWIAWRRDSEQQLAGQIAPHLLRHLFVPAGSTSWLTPIRLLLPIWLISVVAIAGPSFRRKPSPFGDDLAPLMIVMRVSDSMMSPDLSPSRFERVRIKLSQLLEERGSAGTGLVAYDGSAHLVMPITSDNGVIDHMLESLRADIMPVKGDALSDAVRIAFSQNDQSGGGGTVLIVTDSAVPIELDPPPSQKLLFYAALRDRSELQASGIEQAADRLNADTQVMTADDVDVNRLLAHADRSIVEVTTDDSSNWRDDGYWLIPILMIGSLVWARRGWSVPL
ncbi:MAG: VWA domain-containing protein [Planctomycetota bacterium]